MFEFVRDAGWDEVARAWKEREEAVWRAHYRERGFETWDSWRESYIQDFELSKRRWTIETIVDLLAAVPGFFVGAYKGWRKYYPEEKTVATFADIVRHTDIRNNTGVQYWLDHVPAKTQLILFRCGNDIVVRDGTHRCAAIALCAMDEKSFPCQVEAAVAEFDESERDLFLQAIDQRFAKHVDAD